MFNHQRLDCDGQFRFLNLHQQLLYTGTFEKGLMRSSGLAQQRQKTKANAVSQDPIGVAGACIDWYLVTYNTDTGEVLDEEYLYTTCDDNSGGGGDGSSGPSPDDKIGLMKQESWVVYNDTTYGLFYIQSTERLEGVRDSSVFGGHFTAITHLNSTIFLKQQDLPVVYTELAVTDALFSETMAESTLNGKASFPGGLLPDKNIYGWHAFLFWIEFP
jgi:hypothetical protein